jgi:hypothetical protein
MGTVGVTFLLGVMFLAVQGGQVIFSSHKARAGFVNSLILTGDAIRASAVAITQKPPMGLLPQLPHLRPFGGGRQQRWLSIEMFQLLADGRVLLVYSAVTDPD